MAIPVFLGYSLPIVPRQVRFINGLAEVLRARGMEPRTLGVTDHDSDTPLRSIRRIMVDSNGVVSVALRRLEVVEPRTGRPQVQREATAASDVWTTSPYCHIEPTLAFSLGLPVLLVREAGVLADGVFTTSDLGHMSPEVDLSTSAATALGSPAWTTVLARWEHDVRTVADRKGRPARMY